MNIKYIHEPTDLQCGQAVLAMLLGTSPEYICGYLGNDRETDLREMKRVLTEHAVKFSPQRKQAQSKKDLPQCALLSLETPRCWHWSLYADGVFYDPEHGVLEDFPESARKFYWEIISDTLPFAGGHCNNAVFRE
ncbi:MAG: hypothetical protein J6A19_13205 [Oscillospiraceae bacterium]|nr:hypothetical protein [Oscillospiraceae bacterium]